MAGSAQDPPYLATRDPEGSLQQIIRQKDGVRIALDENDQGFCDYLTWASHQEPIGDTKPFGIKAGGSYFANKESLIGHCKQNGFMIYTEQEPLRDNHLIQRGETIHH